MIETPQSLEAAHTLGAAGGGRARAALAAAREAGLGLAGIALLLAAWQIAALSTPDLPAPAEVLALLARLLSDPFYDNGPNDRGIGLQVLASLQRVFSGWAIGALIAVPLGVALGSSRALMSAINPIVQILRPVSPLAWYPIGLTLYQNVAQGVIFTIVITSLWPTLINTMVGVASLPEDYRNVARVFSFSRRTYVTHVLLPYAATHVVTGLRLSMGVAWLVIVAAEMLAGGAGVGFFIWDAWNAFALDRVMAGILVIGLVGLALDRALDGLGRWVGGRS